MKFRFILSTIVITVVSFFTSLLLSADSEVYAQRERVVGPYVKQTASVTKVVSSKSSAFARAAAENARLRGSLLWAFGGKAQTGWAIYVPLISHTIGTDAAPESDEFALALSNWQGDAGIMPSGILDPETLAAFTKHWQSKRLGRSGLIATDSLRPAPIGEFFDPTRSPDLLQLDQETYAAYQKMVAAAVKDLGKELKVTKTGELAPDEKFFRIVSAYRSPEYQAALRKREPNAGRAALAKHSPHSTGHALDIYVGGEPVRTLDSNRLIQVQTPAYKWLVKNAHRFGFYPYFYEPWHWEYVPGKN